MRILREEHIDTIFTRALTNSRMDLLYEFDIKIKNLKGPYIILWAILRGKEPEYF